MRLRAIDAAFASDGKLGYPVPVARYLGARYGYAPERAARALERMREVLGTLDEQLQQSRAAGQAYLMGAQLTALDIYAACCIDTIAPLPPELCPMHPVARAAFEWTQADVGDALPPALIEHRDMMHERHLPLPMQL